jgi:hypothetical protein
MPNLKPCCGRDSVMVGDNPKYGPIYRCRNCTMYWYQMPRRLIPGNEEEDCIGKPEYEPVHYGPGELGLAIAIQAGMQPNSKFILEFTQTHGI